MEAFEYAKSNNKDVHFLGLVSNGGIHSHINHLKGLLDAANDYGLSDVYLHAFTDGRDCDPKSGKYFINDIQEHMKKTTGELATITGRYYAMDRDKRWERVKLAYDALVNGIGTKSTNAEQSILDSYANNVTDEFIKPVVMTDPDGNANTTIKEDDVVIFFNFGTDRGRQLTEVLSQSDNHEYDMHKILCIS